MIELMTKSITDMYIGNIQRKYVTFLDFSRNSLQTPGSCFLTPTLLKQRTQEDLQQQFFEL